MFGITIDVWFSMSEFVFKCYDLWYILLVSLASVCINSFLDSVAWKLSHRKRRCLSHSRILADHHTYHILQMKLTSSTDGTTNLKATNIRYFSLSLIIRDKSHFRPKCNSIPHRPDVIWHLLWQTIYIRNATLWK